MSRNHRGLASICFTASLLSACEYGGLLRPSVLEQLEPPVVGLLNTLPEVDRPNEAVIARIFATGGATNVEVGSDGVMRDEIWARPGQMIWTPSLIVMPRGGDLELTFHNPDEGHHMAYMPSNGSRQVLELPPATSGSIRLNLDEPGLYWFGCPVANHAGRNMLGFILVKGEVPEAAKLQRSPQPRPEED